MLTTLASSQLLRIDKRLAKAADLSEVEGDLGRGDVLGQCVNFVLEAIPLEGLFYLAVETSEDPIELSTSVCIDGSRRKTCEVMEEDLNALAPSMECAEAFRETGELLEGALKLEGRLRNTIGVAGR